MLGGVVGVLGGGPRRILRGQDGVERLADPTGPVQRIGDGDELVDPTGGAIRLDPRPDRFLEPGGHDGEDAVRCPSLLVEGVPEGIE